MRVKLTAPQARSYLAVAVAAVVSLDAMAPAHALPEIRTHASNRVPACVTPDRLMRFLAVHNQGLDPNYRGLALLYKRHGDANRVRWDYAFFQMILETNYLKFRNGSGRGDVNARQNNFAGIGTTGGGVPGDSFSDVSQGVLAQIQHLVVYSGERLDNPVARRTRDVQDDVVRRSKALGRPVTFRDLSRRWATDRRYGTHIEALAARFRSDHCAGGEAPEPARSPSETPVATSERKRDGVDARSGTNVVAALFDPPRPAQRPTGCRVFTASYGGDKAVLVRAVIGNEWHYTALQVLDGQEAWLADQYIRTHARGGDALGEYATRDAALGRAFDLCPRPEKSTE